MGIAASARTQSRAGVPLAGCLLLLLAGCAAEAHPPADSLRADSMHAQPRLAPAATAPSAGTRLATLPGVDLPGKPPAPKPAVAETFTGLASWYGRKFHGRLTASGEPYDMAALTAAHQTLPFGSRVRVTNLANGRSVVVVINDRGPFAKDRLIDLSHGAAQKLGIVEDGVAEVRVDVLADATDVAG